MFSEQKQNVSKALVTICPLVQAARCSRSGRQMGWWVKHVYLVACYGRLYESTAWLCLTGMQTSTAGWVA